MGINPKFRLIKLEFFDMKLFGIFAFASVAMAQFGDYDLDALGNKKPSSAVDKGPRECNGHKLSDSMDKSKLWKCTSRNPDNKNPHLTKRCKLKCKKGKSRKGEHKVYCKSGHGWVLRKGERKVTPGTCTN